MFRPRKAVGAWLMHSGVTGTPIVIVTLVVFLEPSLAKWESDDAHVSGVKCQATQAASDARKAAQEFGDDLPPGAIRRLGSMRFRAAGSNEALAISPTGYLLVSAGARRSKLSLWDATTGRFLRSVPIPQSGFPAPRLAFLADGKKLAISGATFALIDLTGKACGPIPESRPAASHFALSADARLLAEPSAATNAPGVSIRDLTTGKQVSHLIGEAGAASPVVFAPDGKTLATGGPRRTIRLWDVATGRQLRLLDKDTGRIDAMGFAPSGKVLAAATYAGSKIKCWDVETGRLLLQLPDEADAMCTNIHFSPDGKLVATAGEHRALVLWDAETGKQVRRWFPHADWVTAIAFSPDGKVLASTGFRDFGIRRWNVASGKEISPPTGHTGGINRFACTRNGQTLFSLSDGDKRVLQWDLATGRAQPCLFPGPLQPNADDEWWNPSDLAPDGKSVAFMPQVWDKQGKSLFVIRLVDTASGAQTGLLVGHKGHAGLVRFSPDGKRLVSSGEDGVILWEIATRKELRRYKGHRSPAFSSDGRVLAAFEPARGTIDFWDAATGNEVAHWQDRKLERQGPLVFSPDLAHVAVGDVFEASVTIRSMKTGEEVRFFHGKPPVQETRRLGRPTPTMLDPVFSRTGRIVATVMLDGLVTLWDMLSGQVIRQFDTGQGELSAVAFVPGDRVLVTGGVDSSILLWDLTGFFKYGEWAPPAMTPADRLAYWSDIARDAVKAERALWAFGLSPQASVSFIEEHLFPAHDPTQIAKWIDDLDSDTYEIRTTAGRALEQVGPIASSALRKSLKGNCTLEFRRRVDGLLASYTQQETRDLRVVDALEHMNTAKSWELLDRLAAGARGEFATAAAAAALKRRIR
jgi:WD40 repeat protein